MSASLVFRLAHTRLAALAALVAVAGLLAVRARKPGVCPVAPRSVGQAPVQGDVPAQSIIEPWFTGRYSEQLIATSKRGLDSQDQMTTCSAQTGVEDPGLAA